MIESETSHQNLTETALNYLNKKNIVMDLSKLISSTPCERIVRIRHTLLANLFTNVYTIIETQLHKIIHTFNLVFIADEHLIGRIAEHFIVINEVNVIGAGM